MSPQAPWNLGQFWMLRLLRQVFQSLQKSFFRAGARIAPLAAVIAFSLMIGRSQQGTVPLAGQGLPVQVIGSGLATLAGTDTTAMLVDDDGA